MSDCGLSASKSGYYTNLEGQKGVWDYKTKREWDVSIWPGLWFLWQHSLFVTIPKVKDKTKGVQYRKAPLVGNNIVPISLNFIQ